MRPIKLPLSMENCERSNRQLIKLNIPFAFPENHSSSVHVIPINHRHTEAATCGCNKQKTDLTEWPQIDRLKMHCGVETLNERSPNRTGLRVNFSDKGEVKERREKFLTAKYGSHQMSLIRKRLAVEMWLYDELQKLFDPPVSYYGYHFTFIQSICGLRDDDNKTQVKKTSIRSQEANSYNFLQRLYKIHSVRS